MRPVPHPPGTLYQASCDSIACARVRPLNSKRCSQARKATETSIPPKAFLNTAILVCICLFAWIDLLQFFDNPSTLLPVNKMASEHLSIDSLPNEVCYSFPCQSSTQGLHADRSSLDRSSSPLSPHFRPPSSPALPSSTDAFTPSSCACCTTALPLPPLSPSTS